MVPLQYELFFFVLGGQFTPARGGQFEPAQGGHIKPARGGQYHRHVQDIPEWLRKEVNLYSVWFPVTFLKEQNNHIYNCRYFNESISTNAFYLEFNGFYDYYREKCFDNPPFKSHL
jgi:hypothetical protein